MRNALSKQLNTAIELAEGLQNSNIEEVAQVSKGLLALKASYDELLHKYTKQTTEIVIKKHAGLLKRLAESGD